MGFMSAVLFGMFEALLLLAVIIIAQKGKKLIALLFVLIKIAFYVKEIYSLVKKELFSELYLICGFAAGFCCFVSLAVIAFFVLKAVKSRQEKSLIKKQ